MRNDLDIPFPEPGAAIGEPYGRSSYAGRAGSGGMDPNTRRLAIIAGSIGGALLLLVGVWSAMGPRHGGIPVIEADARPVRERPVNKGGLSVIGADESGLTAESDGKAVVTPAPESPALAALKATPPAAPVVASTATPSASTSAPAPAPAVASQEVPPSSFGAPVAVPPAPAVAAAPLPAAQRVALTPLAPVPVPTPSTPPAALPAARPAAPATGNAQVQLAAVGSEEAAQAEWQRLAKKLPDLLGNRRPAVSKTERGGKTFWRVRTGGFTDVASATTFCNQVRAKGGSCSLASF